MPSELTLGGTINPSAGEGNFIGFIKEFRWWNVTRSAFDILAFYMTSFTTVPLTLVAYWRLDEPNDGTATVFKDSSGTGTNFYDPTTASPAFTV